MTKSSEGTMTAKEKVLKVWPDAVAIQTVADAEHESYWWIYCGDHLVGADEERLGRGETEEAAWQNAAESLPAEVEQEPVAPVEAKEKCGATFEANMPWRICNLLKGHDSMHHHDGIYWVFDAREPRLEAARQLLPYIYPNADEESKEILARMLSENVEGMGMIPLFYRAMDMQMELNRPKPHPDSSSISEQTAKNSVLKTWPDAHEYFDGATYWVWGTTSIPKICIGAGSSSDAAWRNAAWQMAASRNPISGAGQTFDAWLGGYISPPIGDLGFQYTTAVEMMRAAWNAAKGSR